MRSPFKVVVDAFMTDTAELADLVLPCTLNLEQENLNPSYFHDFINYARPAFTPPAGARSDHWILDPGGAAAQPAGRSGVDGGADDREPAALGGRRP